MRRARCENFRSFLTSRHQKNSQMDRWPRIGDRTCRVPVSIYCDSIQLTPEMKKNKSMLELSDVKQLRRYSSKVSLDGSSRSSLPSISETESLSFSDGTGNATSNSFLPMDNSMNRGIRGGSSRPIIVVEEPDDDDDTDSDFFLGSLDIDEEQPCPCHQPQTPEGSQGLQKNLMKIRCVPMTKEIPPNQPKGHRCATKMIYQHPCLSFSLRVLQPSTTTAHQYLPHKQRLFSVEQHPCLVSSDAIPTKAPSPSAPSPSPTSRYESTS